MIFGPRQLVQKSLGLIFLFIGAYVKIKDPWWILVSGGHKIKKFKIHFSYFQ